MQDLVYILTHLEEFVPAIFQFYLPGFIFLRIVGSTKSSDSSGNRESGKFIIEVVISYIILLIVWSLFPCIVIDPIRSSIFSISLAILCGYSLLYIFKRNHEFKKRFTSFLGYTDENPIHDLINLSIGAFIRATFIEKINNKVLTVDGAVYNFDTIAVPKFITLVNYSIVNNSENDLVIDKSIIDPSCFTYLVIPLDAVLYLEIVEGKKDNSTK